MRNSLLMLAIAAGLGFCAPSAEAVSAPTAEIAPVDGRTHWVVVFEEPAAAMFRGFRADDSRRPALAATSIAVTGERKYDSRSRAARAYVDYLGELRRLRLADASVAIGRPLQPHFIYSHALNGVSLRLTAAEAAVIADLPGIRAVAADFRMEPETNRSAAWVNADDVWNGTVTDVPSRRGQGIVVGVVDGGIYRPHVTFAGTGITNPRGSGNYLGYCTVNAAACNNKVIGLYDFVRAADGLVDPNDDTVHGTHVASIAIGNRWGQYGGIAPAANLVHYRGCCDNTSILASIDQAVEDGVDVITMSIGGDQMYDPWTAVIDPGDYDDAEAYLAAREAGIVVVKSAGNAGSGPGTITYPGNAPWMIAVAAARHDGEGVALGDRVVDFSSRGPSLPFGVVKPDITAPGVNIVAAGTSGTQTIGTLSGTSMAAPQVAGAAALLLSIDPARTPDQIVSALLLGARQTATTAPGVDADPHTRGAGVLDVARAARAGLYLQVPPNGFRNARANAWTGDADAMNLPSLAHGACFRTCALTRTITRMPGAPATTYSIAVTMDSAAASVTTSVPSFVASDAGTTVTFNVDVDDPTLLNRWIYGTATLTNTAGDGRPDLRMPIAVFATPFSSETAAEALAPINRTVDRERGYFDIALDDMVALPDARFQTTALVAPVTTTQTIAVDPTSSPYDDTPSNYVRLVAVPANAAGLPFEVIASTRAANPDIDLYVGFDSNGNGLPESDEELCKSISNGSDEDCLVELTTAAAAGNVWVMVQNYAGPGTAVTVETLGITIAPSASTSLVATGPGHVPLETPFKVRVSWDDPTFVAGGVRRGYLFTSPVAGAPPLRTPIRLQRTGSGFVPFGLTPGIARTVGLPAGGAHDLLYVDVPPGVTQMTLRTTNGSGEVTLYAARTDLGVGPTVAAAPARNAPGVLSSPAAGANDTIVVNNPAAGRWYLTPVNTGAGVARVDVSATFNSVGAVPVLKRGSYFNPARGGHGIFLYPSGPDLALLWYTYLQDGTPTWYYAQGTQPTGSQVWSGTVYRAAWNGTSRTLEAIGNIVLTPSSATTVSLTYNIDGFTGAETLDTFLTGCPTVNTTPLDVSAHWFDTVSPGYGYSVQVNPNYEFLATFVYDGLGVPRFLAAERGDAFAAASTSLPLDQLAGFAPLGTYAAPTRTTVGSLTRNYGAATIVDIGTTATFVNGVPGTWARNAPVTRLSDLPQGCTP